jgi:hypothetical protein
MYAVAAGPDRYVAVGAVGLTDFPPAGMAWTSTDGLTWSRTTDPWRDGRATRLIHDELGYVAWGQVSDSSGPAIWISPDGASWSRAADIASFGDIVISGIARLGEDLVLIAGDLRAWTSRDGLAWQPLGPVATNLEGVSVWGVTSVEGALLAWGSTPASDVYRPVTLRSTDAQHWERGGIEAGGEEFLSQGILDIVAVGGSVVAVGHGLTGDAGSPPPPTAAWASADGLAWSPAVLQPAGSSGALGHVAWDGRYVALGTVLAASISWWSEDGLTWAEGGSVPDTGKDGEEVGCTGGPCPRTFVSDLTAGPAGPVAVGETTAATGGRRAAVWLAP